MTGAIPSATRRLHQSRTRCTVNTLWLVNGSSTGVDPADRGLAYGDGLFETMAASDGRIRWLDLHLDRLEEGCRRLEIPAPSRNLLAGEIAAHCPQQGRAVVKLIVTRGPGHARLSAAGPGHTDARAHDFVVARLFRRLLSRRDQRARLSAAAGARILRSQASSTCAASSKYSRNSSFAATPCNKG